jgi:hypothetical protein
VEVPAPPPSGPDALEELIDRDVWPAVQHEYGRLAATPGPIVAALAALGIGGAVVSRRLRGGDRTPRLIGFVEPRRVRRQSRLSGLRRGLAQHLHRR